MLQGSSKELHYIRCAKPAGCATPNANWIKCIGPTDDTADVAFQYILAFELNKEKHSLQTVLDDTRSKNLLGYILVNYQDSVDLPDEFWDCDFPQNSSFCILKKKDGTNLLSLLSGMDNPGDLQVSVALETSVDVLPLNDMDKPLAEDDRMYLCTV